MPPGRDSKDERRRTKDRDRDKDRDKDRHKDRDRDKDRHKDRDRDRERHKDRDRDRDRDRDKERHKDRDRDKDRHRDRDDRRKDEDRRERKHREKENGHHDDKSRLRRDEDDKKERRHKDERRHRDDKDRHRRHRDDEDRHRRHRDDEEEDRERRHRRDRDDRDRHRDGKEERRRHKDGDDDRRRHGDRDEEEEEERRRRRERRERRKREEEEERRRQEEERKAKEKEEADYNYDDEEFEDYEDDDFEDDLDDDDDEDGERNRNEDDSSSSTSTRNHSNNQKNRFNDDMDDILNAMNQENDRLLNDARSNQYREPAEEPRRRDRPSSSKRTFINFVSAKQRQINTKASSKAARRGQELLQMIELDKTGYDMFDMPPVTEYNMYMRSFGSSNTKQAYIQTNDDSIDRELQTEEIETAEKWCQQPPSDVLSSGAPDDKPKRDPEDVHLTLNTARLTQFLERAGQVICVLLEESNLEQSGQEQSRSKQSNIIVSDAFSELSLPKFLRDRPVLRSHISPVQTHMLLTVHQTPDQPSSDILQRQGCVCVWNVNEPSQPQKILMCESRPHCCCFGPTKTSLVFAGMHDGSVVVWDLREQISMHRSHTQGHKTWQLRYPTYNTAGVLSYENHQSSVVAIQPIVAAGESESASLQGLAQSGSDEGLSFQLATLEENGVIQLWVVAELSQPDLAGSESDLGLAPGGKVKLVKSSSITLESPIRGARFRTTMKCADLQLLPSNNSHYFVASDTGCVLHGLRYGGKAPPRAYRPAVENLVQVTSVDFSPFPEPVFLAGGADGSLRLYHADTEWPLMSWPLSTGGRPIQQVCWCRSRPAVFFVLDADSTLYIWDLLMDDSSPVKQEVIAQKRVTSLSLSNDHASTGLGLPGRRPQMVVCLENGACEVHTMSQQFSALMSDELDQFVTYLKKNG